MSNVLISLIAVTGALTTGGAIGFLFGVAQNYALTRNKKMKDEGMLRTGWAIMPGSMSRIAFLLFVLAAVQLFCPMFFQGDIQWLVSVGLLLGYGASFVRRLHQRAKESF